MDIHETFRSVFDYIPENNIKLFEGRPKRDLIINKDDIINLRITINTVETFEEFIKEI